jgi:hypothetical protein
LRGINITPRFIGRHASRFNRELVDRYIKFAHIPGDAPAA